MEAILEIIAQMVPLYRSNGTSTIVPTYTLSNGAVRKVPQSTQR